MSAKKEIAKSGRVEVVIDAPAEAVWRVVSDLTRSSEWSHECYRATWLPGVDGPELGARFRGSNRSGRLRWTRTCEIVAYRPPHEIEWRTLASVLQPDSTDWCITLEPVGSGTTRIIQTFTVTRMPRWLNWILTRFNPLHIDRTQALTEDLHRIGSLTRPPISSA